MQGFGRVRVGEAAAYMGSVVCASSWPSMHECDPACMHKFKHMHVSVAGLACSSPLPFTFIG